MKTGRLQAFSDGVFAILITILVLDFKVPSYTPGHLITAVLHQWPTLAAYVLWAYIHMSRFLIRERKQNTNE